MIFWAGFFSFSLFKKKTDCDEVDDENMNAVTLAGETSPPKSADKRLVQPFTNTENVNKLLSSRA